MTITDNQAQQTPEWEFLNYLDDLEQEWRQSLPRYTDKELLEIFPEAKNVVREKIKKLEEIQTKLSNSIKEKLAIIKYRIADEFTQWFWREWVKATDGERLLEVEKRLDDLKWSLRNKPLAGRITDEQIRQALSVPIERLISQPLRRRGKTFVSLCPFHKEQHASFHIYPETNTCWCYGCNQGGNTINLVRLLHGFSFKEAIGYLASK
jgi:hypothetical protein